MKVDGAALIAALRSSDLDTQGPALIEAARITQELTAEAIGVLAATPNPAVVADLIARFAILNPPLENLVNRTDLPIDTRVFAATLLLHFGSRSGIPFLLDTLIQRKGPLVHIAIWMGKAGVVEARETIKALLQECEHQRDVHNAATLRDVLKALAE